MNHAEKKIGKKKKLELSKRLFTFGKMNERMTSHPIVSFRYLENFSGGYSRQGILNVKVGRGIEKTLFHQNVWCNVMSVHRSKYREKKVIVLLTYFFRGKLIYRRYFFNRKKSI